MAVFDASEALRISGGTCQKTQAPCAAWLASHEYGFALDTVGWWQTSSVYLASLLQMGELHEMLGAPDDAIHALKEGEELVRPPWRCYGSCVGLGC